MNSALKISTEYIQLIKTAAQASLKAYAPYSHFKVGAALLTKKNKIYTGCNIENSSYGLTICAERTAIIKAVSEGEKSFKAIAIFNSKNKSLPPCGACRQFILEFGEDIDIIFSNPQKNFIHKSLDLLPLAFTNKNIKL